jgi:coatomer subunit beta
MRGCTQCRELANHLFPCFATSIAARAQVAINTSISDVNGFLEHIIASTNMRCLTPPRALEGECGYAAANLYARSVFGEDALVNVSVEDTGSGRLAGYIRIRSKTQGIALSLGDKITLKQKG